MRPHVRTLLIASALAALAAPARAESAADRATARSLAEAGIALQTQGKWAEALDKLQRAQALFAAPPHLLHIAECQAALGQLVEAAETYRALGRVALDAKSPAPFRAARDAGARELAALEPRIPSLRVEVQPAPRDLALRLDGAPVSSAIVGVDRPTNPGKHEVTATASGYAEATASVKLAEAERRSLRLALAQVAVPIAVAPPPAAPPKPAEAKGPVEPSSAEPAPAAATPATPSEAPSAPGYHLHDGFFLRIAAGSGAYSDDEKVAATEVATGATISETTKITGTPVEAEIAIGGAVTPGLVLAATVMSSSVSGPTLSANGVTQTAQSTYTLRHSFVGAMVDWYTDPSGGLHFGGGGGFATMSLKNESGTSTSDTPTPKGFGVVGHVGYSWWIGPNWSVGALGRVMFSRLTADLASSDPAYANGQETDMNVFTTVGVELTYN